MAPDEAEGVEPDLGGFDGFGEGCLLGFQGGDFFLADVIVDLAKVAEAGELVLKLGVNDELGGCGEVFAAFASDFLGAADHFWEDLVFDGWLVQQFLWAATLERGVSEVDLVGDVFEGVIDGDADRGGGQEAIHMESCGGDAFGDEAAVDDESIGFGPFPGGEGGIAMLAAEQEVKGTAHEGVIGGEEGELLAGKGAGAVEGDGEAFFGKGGKGVGEEIAAVEEVVAVGEFFDVKAKEVEHLDEEDLELAFFVHGADLIEQGIDGRCGSRAEF